jgi:hypothetical protein
MRRPAVFLIVPAYTVCIYGLESLVLVFSHEWQQGRRGEGTGFLEIEKRQESRQREGREQDSRDDIRENGCDFKKAVARGAGYIDICRLRILWCMGLVVLEWQWS